MSSLSDIILQQVFPTAGVLTGTFMSFAPYRAVLKASREGTLGDLNPTPWVFMLGNCAGWLAYSFFTRNVYVLFSNAPGFILAIWLNIQAIKLQYENFRSVELQTAIIAALEDMRSVKTNPKSQSALVNKQDVSKLVEHVLVEEPLPIEILDPMTTAPVMEDDHEDAGGLGGLHASAYQATASNTHTDVENDTNNHGALDQNHYSNDHDNDGITSVQEATELIVDYASFVWDIAAQKTPAPASHELMVVGISTVWLLLVAYVVFEYQQDYASSSGILIIGIAVNANLIFFYGAPLSKIATVLAQRSSKSIHVPTMITSLLNGTLWFVYGIAVHDYFIAVPNGFGAALGIVQLFFCMVFPRHSSSSTRKESYVSLKEGEDLGSIASSGTLSLPEESTPLI